MTDSVLVTKLIKSRRRKGDGGIQFRGSVVDLVRQLEDICLQRELQLGRYLTWPKDGRFVIHWVVYRGLLVDTLKEIRQQDRVASFELLNIEGATSRCEAYRKLAEMLQEVSSDE